MPRQPDLKLLCAKEQELAVWEWPGEGPALLFAHATGFHGRCWDHIIRMFPRRHCLAIDGRGHGRSGKPEPRWHRLRDWRETAAIAAEGGVRLWLHGHRHRPYLLSTHKEIPFPSICGGSATQTGLWGYHDYTVENGVLTAVRRAFDPKTKAFTDRETFQLELGDR